jgi:hypothetical protein
MFAKRAKKGKKSKPATIKKFKPSDIGSLHEKFLQAHHKRIEEVMTSIYDLREYKYPAKDKNFLDLSPGDKTKRGITSDDDDFPDWSINDAPKVKEIFQDMSQGNGFNPDDIFLINSKTKLMFLMPIGFPLSTPHEEDHLQSYMNYIKFFSLFDLQLRKAETKPAISLGRYHDNVAWSPENTDFKARKWNWDRIIKQFHLPKFSTQQPSIQPFLEQIRESLNKHPLPSTPTQGDDCFMFIYHHQLFQDMHKLVNDPQVISDRDYINSKCTLIHMFIGFKGYEDTIRNYMTLLTPELSEKKMLDEKYEGYYILEKGSDLNENFRDKIIKYMGMVRRRQGCMLKINLDNVNKDSGSSQLEKELAIDAQGLIQGGEYSDVNSEDSISAYSDYLEREEEYESKSAFSVSSLSNCIHF